MIIDTEMGSTHCGKDVEVDVGALLLTNADALRTHTSHNSSSREDHAGVKTGCSLLSAL